MLLICSWSPGMPISSIWISSIPSEVCPIAALESAVPKSRQRKSLSGAGGRSSTERFRESGSPKVAMPDSALPPWSGCGGSGSTSPVRKSTAKSRASNSLSVIFPSSSRFPELFLSILCLRFVSKMLTVFLSICAPLKPIRPST